MKLSEKIKLAVSVVLTPSCWFMLNEYSETLDSEINDLLDKGVEFEDADSYESKYIYRANLGYFKYIWVENYPYGALKVGNLRPSRRTILRARPALDRMVLKKFTEIS